MEDLDPCYEEYYLDDYYYDNFCSINNYDMFLYEAMYDKNEQIHNMYNKYNHFCWWIPKKIISIDNLWFTSDEIEAFRVVWQRRISAM